MNGSGVRVASQVPKDPFDSFFEIPGGQLSLTANRTIQDFTITTDSYVLMCAHLYEAFCTENSGFADKISESAFQYYAIMLLWQRLAQFLPPRSRKLSPFLNKLSEFEPYLTGIPKPLETYLKGIGNFTHPYLGQMRFRLPELLISQCFDLTTGTFGKVSADTHFLYEAFPAPGIAALRILNDISNANTLHFHPLWDLPRDLRPDVEYNTNNLPSLTPSNMPTRNLLGWSPAQPLTKNQLELFRSFELEQIVPQLDFSKFFENSKELLKTISRYFNGASNLPSLQDATRSSNPASGANVFGSKPENGTIFFGESNPKSCIRPLFGESLSNSVSRNDSGLRPGEMLVNEKEKQPQRSDSFGNSDGFTKVKRLPFTGSIIQGLSVKKDSESSEFDRSTMYCDGIVSVFSSFEANDILVSGAVVAGYRMPKEPIIHNRHSWSCYDFNQYQSVPESWISTRNAIYLFKNAEGLNKSMWTTGSTEKRLTQYAFLKQYGKASEDNWNVYM